MPSPVSHSFPPISRCNRTDREGHAVAADLDGTLLVSRSSFPYFMILAVEAGSVFRGILLLLSSPAILFLYKLVSESAGIQVLIYISTCRVPMEKIEKVCRVILPVFYGEDVREESWRAFRGCGRKRVVVTANPTVMVDVFVREWLGGDLVIGTELEVKNGKATGWVVKPGVAVGSKKREMVLKVFEGQDLPEMGLGDRESDHDFMALCKEAYMVTPNPSAAKVSSKDFNATTSSSSTEFQGCYFKSRPTPLNSLLTFLWIPFGFILSLPSVFFNRSPQPEKKSR